MHYCCCLKQLIHPNCVRYKFPHCTCSFVFRFLVISEPISCRHNVCPVNSILFLFMFDVLLYNSAVRVIRCPISVACILHYIDCLLSHSCTDCYSVSQYVYFLPILLAALGYPLSSSLDKCILDEIFCK